MTKVAKVMLTRAAGQHGMPRGQAAAVVLTLVAALT